MIIRAVIDTNVLVSAILTKSSDAATVQIMYKFLNGEIVACYCDEMLVEYEEVLNREKFKFDKGVVKYLLMAIEKFGEKISPKQYDVKLNDIKDLPFYLTALETRELNSYLVTGNIKHFPKEEYIKTPREFLDIINAPVEQ